MSDVSNLNLKAADRSKMWSEFASLILEPKSKSLKCMLWYQDVCPYKDVCPYRSDQQCSWKNKIHPLEYSHTSIPYCQCSCSWHFTHLSHGILTQIRVCSFNDNNWYSIIIMVQYNIKRSSLYQSIAKSISQENRKEHKKVKEKQPPHHGPIRTQPSHPWKRRRATEIEQSLP